MKVLILLAGFIIFLSLPTLAQTSYSIKGIVTDTIEKKNLLNASVMVLGAQDSILRKFIRANKNGEFSTGNILAGKYILLISYHGYADYTEDFTLSDKEPHDFGVIKMVLTSHLLEEVIIKSRVVPIKIKGDTTEFNAGAYIVRPNDKVEDLIKQFPGIRVDRFGGITAQGQRIGKVLLDGEEFFGDDPTLVTRNIRADMVDKVQLYDKKSDQATLTGINDGQSIKTLDIKLKADKKTGAFGKVLGGVGTRKFRTGQLMFNKFREKEKIALFGIGSNDGTTGLSGEDNEKFIDSEIANIAEDGSVYFDVASNDIQYNGRGIPKALSSGAHYSNKWNEDKYYVNGNYKIGRLDIDGSQTNINQNNLPNRFINEYSEKKEHNSTYRQKLFATVGIVLDSTSSLKISIDGILKDNKFRSFVADTNRRGGSNTLLNLNNSVNMNNFDNKNLSTNIFFTKKLSKPKRIITVSASGSINDISGLGFLKSKLDYFDITGMLVSSELIDQRKTINNKYRMVITNITYAEPLFMDLVLVLNYGFKINNAQSDQRAYSRPDNIDDYTTIVDSLSNNFKFNQFLHRAGAMFNYEKGKTFAQFGLRVSAASFNQLNIYTGNQLKRNFINWLPEATLRRQITTRQSILLGYGGKTMQPSINQLQPVKDNSNPLYVTLGNPDLKPSFLNYIGVLYNNSQVLNDQNISISVKYNVTSNAIVNNTFTDSAGKTTIQFFNIGSRSPYNFVVNGEYSRRLKGIDITAGITLNLNKSTSYNMVGNTQNQKSELNTTKNIIYTGSLFFNKYVQDKFDASASFGPQYSINQSSLQRLYNSNGGGFNGQADLSLYLLSNLKLTSNIDYTYTASTRALPQGFSRTLWNASLNKSFLKEKNLTIAASINDILNQNKGFYRNAYGSIVSEERYMTIKRYFMFTFTYDFAHMGGKTND